MLTHSPNSIERTKRQESRELLAVTPDLTLLGQALNKALMRTTNRKMRRKAGKEGPNRGPQMRRTSRDYLS